jgi:hypothetical protein
MPTLLVLDFDGTMTDAEAEGAPFRAGYLDDLCMLVGRPAGDPEIHAIADAVEAELAAAPASHPFLWMGRAVAPATVDPYLRMVPIAHRVLDRFEAIPSPLDRGRLLGGVLYKYNYGKTLGRPVFRANAGHALSQVADKPTWIVTNSDTHHVAGKVTALAKEHPGVESLAARVRGMARKFDVTDAWDGVAAELPLPGLDRPVLLRRHAYHDILAALLQDHGSTWSDLVVVGDIFELDLAMPLALGARVGLVASSRTPAYERAYVESHPRARIINDLAEIPAFAFGV